MLKSVIDLGEHLLARGGRISRGRSLIVIDNLLIEKAHLSRIGH
jgi:hypothetical protein